MSKSRLESDFKWKWKAIEGPEYEEEFRFHYTRKWRLDFAWPRQRVAVEIQGGIWMRKGGHNTGRGISRDAEKLNEAQFLGWRIFQLTPEMITIDNLERIKNLIECSENR